MTWLELPEVDGGDELGVHGVEQAGGAGAAAERGGAPQGSRTWLILDAQSSLQRIGDLHSCHWATTPIGRSLSVMLSGKSAKGVFAVQDPFPTIIGDVLM